MSVYKRANSKYYYTELTVPKSNRKIIRSTKTTQKSLAMRFEHALRESLYKQHYLGEIPAISIDDAITHFEVYQSSRVNPRNLKAQVIALRSQLSRVSNLNHDLHTLSTQNLVNLVHIRRGEVSDGTIQLLLISIRSMIKLCVGQYLTPANLVYPKVKLNNARTRVLTSDEQKRLLAELKPQDGEISDNYDLVVLLLSSGARLNEIQQMKWSQVDLVDGILKIYRSKTGTESIIRLTQHAKQILIQRKAVSGNNVLVFPNSKGGKRTCTPKAIHNAYKRIGLDGFCTHLIRHTVASNLLNNGMSLFEVSRILGHSSINTATRYSHLEQRAVADKAAMILELNCA
jgi:integrase